METRIKINSIWWEYKFDKCINLGDYSIIEAFEDNYILNSGSAS